MRQKWLIISTQTFSIGIRGKKKLCFDDLPWPVRMFTRFFKYKVTIIFDEISYIKTNDAMAEVNKSSRCRNIKQLTDYSACRMGLTGTLMTKSPLNVVDPYQFLSKHWFENEYMGAIEAQYSVTMTLRTARGRRVQISQKEWDRARKRMINAYKLGKDTQLNYAISRIYSDIGISKEDCEHILKSRTFTPFKNIDSLMKRLSSVTMTVNRADIFDIAFDKKVYEPIMRFFKVSSDGVAIGKELIKVGFTDNYVLGRAPALELLHRLKDVCNGFEPVQTEEYKTIKRANGVVEAKPIIRFDPLKENPKLDTLVELLDDIDIDQNQVAIYISRRNALTSVEQRLTSLKIPFVTYSGAQNKEEKQEAEKKIRDGSARIFIANPSSASFGLNALRNVNYIIWYCLDASVEKYHQAQHRILRGQSKVRKFAYMICAKGSVEERNVRSLAAGEELLSASNRKEIFEFL